MAPAKRRQQAERNRIYDGQSDDAGDDQHKIMLRRIVHAQSAASENREATPCTDVGPEVTEQRM